MEIKITSQDIVWSYGSKILQIGSGILILPLILNKLTNQEIGIWYIFIAVTALVNLLDFGLQPNISRNTSYIFSGASELIKEGTNVKIKDKITYELLMRFIGSVRRLYQGIAFFAFIILITIGTYYIYDIAKDKLPLDKVLVSWGIYAISSSFNLYYYYYTSLLIGQGKFKESNKALVYSKLIYIFSTLVMLSLGFGLVGCSLSYLISALVNRVLSRKYFYDKELKNITKDLSLKYDAELVKMLWYNSKKFGFIAIAYFLMTRATTLIVGQFLSLEVVANYGLSVQLIDVIAGISTMPLIIFIPKLNMFAIKKKDNEFKSYTGVIWLMSISIFIIGSIFLILIGNQLLFIIKTTVKLIASYQLVILCLVNLLGINYSIFCQIISTNNTVPYYKASILSGIGIVSFSFILLKYSNLGLNGVIFAPLIIQLLYNFWKWPVFFMKKFNTNYKELVQLGCLFLKNQFKEKF